MWFFFNYCFQQRAVAIFLWRRISVARTDRPGSGFCICLRNWPGWVFAASLLASHRIPQLFLFNSQTKWGDSVKTTTEADREKMKEEREGERRREGRDTDDKLAPQLILIRAKGKTSVSLKEHWVPWYKQFFFYSMKHLKPVVWKCPYKSETKRSEKRIHMSNMYAIQCIQIRT